MKTKTKNYLCTPALAKAEMEHPHAECRTEQEAGEKRDREQQLDSCCQEKGGNRGGELKGLAATEPAAWACRRVKEEGESRRLQTRAPGPRRRFGNCHPSQTQTGSILDPSRICRGHQQHRSGSIGWWGWSNTLPNQGSHFFFLMFRSPFVGGSVSGLGAPPLAFSATSFLRICPFFSPVAWSPPLPASGGAASTRFGLLCLPLGVRHASHRPAAPLRRQIAAAVK